MMSILFFCRTVACWQGSVLSMPQLPCCFSYDLRSSVLCCFRLRANYPLKTHSYIAEDVLLSQLIRSQTGVSYPSMSELRSVLGRRTFDLSMSECAPPVQSLRNLFKIHRELIAHPIAVLRGFLYKCFICGKLTRRMNTDVCQKAFRYPVGNSNVVYWHPNSVLLDVRRTEPAVQALKITDDTRVDGSCAGPVSTTHLHAAVERSSRKTVDQHGVYTMSCSHECCDSAVELPCPESVSGHHTLGLTLACASGCDAFVNDIMCVCRRHLQARGGLDLITSYAGPLWARHQHCY